VSMVTEMLRPLGGNEGALAFWVSFLEWGGVFSAIASWSVVTFYEWRRLLSHAKGSLDAQRQASQ
jgi:hypothetical protein